MTNDEKCAIPGDMLPSYRYEIAAKKGLTRKLLFTTWGGLGDQICAEPTLRYALKIFDKSEVSLATPMPSVFRHLPFKRIFDTKEEQPIYENYFKFDTIVPPTHLMWNFVSHAIVNCVDFPSMCAFRSQLPVADREVKIPIGDDTIENDVIKSLVFQSQALNDKFVVIHAGRHWQSKTFPKDWWDSVIANLLDSGMYPVLIGANTDDNRGTVDVDSRYCLDLRNSLSVRESIWLCQKAKVVLTNDSSPLHMAVTGDAFIGFIATCKHPDYIMHWRNGEWAWRMENLGLGGIWEIMDFCPNAVEDTKVDLVEESILRSWLPEPRKVAEWTRKKMESWTPREKKFQA